VTVSGDVTPKECTQSVLYFQPFLFFTLWHSRVVLGFSVRLCFKDCSNSLRGCFGTAELGVEDIVYI
jgi:hypothetical protein